MSTEPYELKAEARDRVGKGSARALRRSGHVPAVIYGDKKPPVSIALPHKEVTMKIHGGGFLTTVATIDVDGEKHKVLPKDFQVHPVTDAPVHIDFLRIGQNTVVTVMIPIHFINEDDAPGLTRGGVLNIVRHEIEVSCRADAIPDYFEVNLDGLDIDDVVHVSTITLPEGVELTVTDRDYTVATIAPPTVYRETEIEEGAEEGAEKARAEDAEEAEDEESGEE
jgi:large subunit ribosomal protein L25